MVNLEKKSERIRSRGLRKKSLSVIACHTLTMEWNKSFAGPRLESSFAKVAVMGLSGVGGNGFPKHVKSQSPVLSGKEAT